MRILEVYNQVSKLTRPAQVTRRYENAALQRKDAPENLSNLDFKKAYLEKQEQNRQSYPTYKNFQLNQPQVITQSTQVPILPGEETSAATLPSRTPIQLQQMKDALATYRKMSGQEKMYPVELIQFAENTSIIPNSGGQMTLEAVISKYKTRLGEISKNHERELWTNYNSSHMVFVDNGTLATTLGQQSGQVINLVL